MRKGLQNVENPENRNYKIIAVDDEEGIIDSLSIFLKRTGYDFTGVTDPQEAIQRVKNEHFDLMILDFIMTPFHGDQVVEEIRKFNKELYILLLTGHKDLAPPLETIKRLDIQGYCEKSDKFDQLLLLIESGIKSIAQMREIQKINVELRDTYEKLEQAYLESIQTGVPDTILQKESKLTDDEYSEIKNHPSIGAHILSSATIFKDIIPIVKHHHERYDGHGYPSQLAGENIPYLARITAVADTFDAMTSKRSYRDALPMETVISEFERCKGTQFDPKIADVFLDMIRNHFDEIKEIQEKYV